ncbi:1-(5-phosphoribosyl)-5-[(5-phosphoribosylamino)methylideneamino]imidazole-4-carboxamide isomerase [Candidatus Magnetominusculus dajiuhuensis]|uniref:1-(5-phosphoribosyl)-5-[(5- phosphoribosylamino)methylideneamino]imidazole-4- carboxamide isomerase n=1 Tax=Candidatus Magnetominusculus dajiuhuensis TaxID=3137712 RepID=UPI003B43132D
MLVIPAIDLKDGSCVRLLQGRKEDVTKYSEDPVETARRWVREGAELIHIVDLDGAFTGQQKNLESIKNIRTAVDVQLEVGGGIRDLKRIELLDSIGIDKIILGTIAIKDPALLREACLKYPNKIVVGIDAKKGRVAIRGWEEVTETTAATLAKEVENSGASGIIYTDIAKDGMLMGPNVEATAEIANLVNIPVTASGGVASLKDIAHLMTITGLYGIITGKAVYSGAIALAEAIALVRRW